MEKMNANFRSWHALMQYGNAHMDHVHDLLESERLGYSIFVITPFGLDAQRSASKSIRRRRDELFALTRKNDNRHHIFHGLTFAAPWKLDRDCLLKFFGSVIALSGYLSVSPLWIVLKLGNIRHYISNERDVGYLEASNFYWLLKKLKCSPWHPIYDTDEHCWKIIIDQRDDILLLLDSNTIYGQEDMAAAMIKEFEDGRIRARDAHEVVQVCTTCIPETVNGCTSKR